MKFALKVAVQFDRFSLSYLVYARKEIIVSAGSINSPQLLMLSGIGPAEHLSSLGIPTIADLPVGENLQDHIYPGGMHFSINRPYTLTQPRVFTATNLGKYFAQGKGPLTSLGAVEGLAFVRTKFANITLDFPDIEIHLVSASIQADGGRSMKQYNGLTEELWKKVYYPYVPVDTFSLDPVLLHPKSRGYIRLRTANPYDHPIINPRYLTHPDDILAMVEGMKIAIAVGLSAPYKVMGSRLIQTIYPGCESYSFFGKK
ncbi:GMC oxidoreductase-like protein 1 [Leptotrombidium deliense]|uniref:GMC oxidoreductase-like protein 1 n=1 Tax=Leptotrombidium deliense TaxID=299467 RepID=A0A443SM03_9ACAR|nr:GMC oxidoreductase-like protein 1 [Leptotrombidium deliense]